MSEVKKKVNGKKRTPKKGWVYLLQSTDRCINEGFEDLSMYKYGATTKTFTERCRAINSHSKDYKYKPIAAFMSDDIYNDENRVAWGIISHGLGKLSEYIANEELSNKEDVVRKFLSFAKNVRLRKKPSQKITWEA